MYLDFLQKSEYNTARTLLTNCALVRSSFFYRMLLADSPIASSRAAAFRVRTPSHRRLFTVRYHAHGSYRLDCRLHRYLLWLHHSLLLLKLVLYDHWLRILLGHPNRLQLLYW